MPDGPTHIDTYCRKLFRRGFGFPLWCPEPSGSNPTYLSRGVSIGDVGRVMPDGGFETFFNICQAADGQANGGHVPPDFYPFVLQHSRSTTRLKFFTDHTIIEGGGSFDIKLRAGATVSEAL